MLFEKSYIYDKSKFADEAIYNLTIKYVKDKTSTPETLKGKKMLESTLKRFFLKFFTNINLKEVDEKLAYDFLKSNNDKENRHFMLFIFWLYENHFIENEIIGKWYLFKIRYNSNKFSYKELKKIEKTQLLKEHESLFKARKPILNDDERKVYFIEIDDVKDELFNKIILDFSNSIRYGTLKIQVKYLYLINLKNVIETYFSESTIDTINTVYINKVFNKIIQTKCKNEKIRMLNYFLIYLSQHNLLKDNKLIRYSEILQQMTFIAIPKMQELLLSDNIDGYFISKGRLLYIGKTKNQETKKYLIEYSDSNSYDEQSFNDFLTYFFEPINDKSNFSELTIKDIYKQIDYYSQKTSNDMVMLLLQSFYNYVYTKKGMEFLSKNKINPSILLKEGLFKRIKEGYGLIHYNPLEECPGSDKWILCYEGKDEPSLLGYNGVSIAIIDFSSTKNKTHRFWVKSYCWKADIALKTRFLRKRSIEIFIAWKEENNDKIEFTLMDLLLYKQWLNSKNVSERTRETRLRHIKSFFDFLSANNLTTIGSDIYYHLSTYNSKDQSGPKKIPDNDLIKLGKKFKEKSEENLTNFLYYIIFYILLETEFRIGSVLDLEYDCIKPTIKNGEFVITSKTKTSNNEIIEQPISLYTKKQVDLVLERTKELRTNTNLNELQKYLFISERKYLGDIRAFKINKELFRKYIHSLCDELNIPHYTAENLRDTHMTKVQEYSIQKGLETISTNTLTGHKNIDTTTNHYTDIDLQTILEVANKVIIGNVTIEGKIIENNKRFEQEDEVYHNCGYCSNKACDNYSYVSCLLCKHFVTMPSKKPYFKELISVIDKQIKNGQIPHDKEDLYNIKRLLTAYLLKIEEFEGGEIHGDSSRSS